jgi:hypothetical protein
LTQSLAIDWLAKNRMDASKREAISARALTLIRSHFEFLNEGKVEAARKQLFFPRGMADEPLTVCAETMSQLAPFRILSISVSRFEDVRQKKHGAVATIWALKQRPTRFSRPRASAGPTR